MTIRVENADGDLGMRFSETLVPVATLLGGVPLLTVLVMTAARYVASGTL
jgi:hypothetical protein